MAYINIFTTMSFTTEYDLKENFRYDRVHIYSVALHFQDGGDTTKGVEKE